jgi:hypothetical protein
MLIMSQSPTYLLEKPAHQHIVSGVGRQNVLCIKADGCQHPIYYRATCAQPVLHKFPPMRCSFFFFSCLMYYSLGVRMCTPENTQPITQQPKSSSMVRYNPVQSPCPIETTRQPRVQELKVSRVDRSGLQARFGQRRCILRQTHL